MRNELIELIESAIEELQAIKWHERLKEESDISDCAELAICDLNKALEEINNG